MSVLRCSDRGRRQRLAIGRAVVVAGMVLLPATAGAAVDICVRVSAAKKDLAGLQKLVQDELGHHPSHRQVKQGCRSHLQVELFELAGVMFLTARINREVPVRLDIKRKEDLGEKVREALRRVLRHDPVYLAEDIQRYSAMKRATHSVLKGGRNTWRVELFETMINGGENVAFASGGALSVNRGSYNWYVFARLYAGGSLGGTADMSRALRIMAGGELGLSYEFLARSMTTPYLSAGLGLQVLHYEGRLRPGDEDLEDATVKGGTLSLRAGMRFFRASDFDMDIFVAGYLPLFGTNDPDSLLIDSYTPSLQIGLGVGF